jgi:hypothetical protein
MAIPYNVDAVKIHEITGTQFKLGYLDASESAYLDKEFSRVEMIQVDGELTPQIKIDISGKQLEAVRLKLKGAENFGDVRFDLTEKHYPFGKRMVVSDKSLNFVKPYIPELGQAIINQSALTEEQEKN